jgi:hypothetical protein
MVPSTLHLEFFRSQRLRSDLFALVDAAHLWLLVRVRPELVAGRADVGCMHSGRVKTLVWAGQEAVCIGIAVCELAPDACCAAAGATANQRRLAGPISVKCWLRHCMHGGGATLWMGCILCSVVIGVVLVV